MRLRRTVPSLVVLAFVLLVPASAGPRAEFTETSFDAGVVQHGTLLEHEFVVKNTGDEPLQITEVRPSCGCTVADYDSTIPAGASGRIKIKLKTAEVPSGKSSKQITVGTNAEGAERVVLQVRMDLVTPLEFLPRERIYMYVLAGEAKEEKILVRPNTAGMKILDASSSNPMIAVALEPAKAMGAKDSKGLASVLLPRQGDYWMTVSLKKGAPVGRQSADVTVRTSDASYPKGVLRVDAVVKEPGADAKPPRKDAAAAK